MQRAMAGVLPVFHGREGNYLHESIECREELKPEVEESGARSEIEAVSHTDVDTTVRKTCVVFEQFVRTI